MKRTTILWILAFGITAASAIYQRMTGPTYPVSGHAIVGGKAITYKFLRSQGGTADAPVQVQTGEAGVEGNLHWKRLNSLDSWTVQPMQKDNGVLQGYLPHQPPAGKIIYRVVLTAGGEQAMLPGNEDVVLRYKGDVPTAVLIIHVIAMFGAMLLSTRAGLEFFNPEPRLKRLIYWTLGFLALGGLVLGPIVQKYAFGAYWTGWPFGTDLTDNKTVIGLIAWMVAAFALRSSRMPAKWALGASVILLVVFMIPHSVLGSELDYRALDKPQAVPEVIDSVRHQ